MGRLEEATERNFVSFLGSQLHLEMDFVLVTGVRFI